MNGAEFSPNSKLSAFSSGTLEEAENVLIDLSSKSDLKLDAIQRCFLLMFFWLEVDWPSQSLFRALRWNMKIASLCPFNETKNFSPLEKKSLFSRRSGIIYFRTRKWMTTGARVSSCTYTIWRREWRRWCHRFCLVNVYIAVEVLSSVYVKIPKPNSFRRTANRWSVAHSCSCFRSWIFLRIARHHVVLASKYDLSYHARKHIALSSKKRKSFHLD